MDINILRAAATVVTVRIDERSILKKRLMGEDIINLFFTLNTNVSILIGDYITVFSKNYYVNTPPNVRKVSRHKFVYEAKFESLQYELGKVQFLDVDLNGEFFLMANPQMILNLIVTNLNRTGSGWTANTAPSGDYKNYSFSGENCLQVLHRICSELEIEWYLNTKQICMTTLIGGSSGLTFKYGQNLGLYNIVRNLIDSKNIVTRLYAFGSTKNLDYSYGAKRLKLAAPGYLDKNTATYGIIEAVKIFDDIYPHFTGSVDSSPIPTVILDASIDFDLNSYLIEGTTAKIVFLTGLLAGYEFEITVFSYSGTTAVTFKAYTTEEGLILPNATLMPAAGDTYTFVDIKMPAAYITAAETALEVAAQAYLDANADPRVKYAFEMDPLYMEANAISLSLGDTVHITDADLGVDKAIRMIYYERSISRPYLYRTEVSDLLEPQILSRLIAGDELAKRVIASNKLTDTQRIRRSWKTTEELRTMIFGTDDYFDPTNIRPASIETNMLSVGSKNSAFIIAGSVFQPNLLGNKANFNISAGTLDHFTIEASPRTWNLSAFSVTGLTDATAYYIYARCNKVGATAAYIVSATQYALDTSSYYYFLIGILHSVVDSVRDISLTYGNTRINGRTITTGKIQSADGSSYMDLDNNVIVLVGGSAGGFAASTDRLTFSGDSGQTLMGLQNAEITGTAYYGRGFGMYRSDALTPTNGIKAISVGQIRDLDTPTTFPATAAYGFEVIAKTAVSTYKHLIRMAGGTNIIAGWNIDFDAIYIGTKKTSNGFAAAGSFTLAANGSIHAEHFCINIDGYARFDAIESSFKSVLVNTGTYRGRVAIVGNDIYEDAIDDDVLSYIQVNRVGYNGGATRYRNLVIYDGKGGKLLEVTGDYKGDASGGGVDFWGPYINMGYLPSSAAGLSAGDLYQSGGYIRIVT